MKRGSHTTVLKVAASKSELPEYWQCSPHPHLHPPSTAAQCGPWPPHSWSFYITYIDALQSGGLLWASDRLVTETSPCHHTAVTTHIQAPSDIRTHNLSRQAAEIQRPRLRDNRHRSPCLYRAIFWLLNENKGNKLCSEVIGLVHVLGVLYTETGALTCRHILR